MSKFPRRLMSSVALALAMSVVPVHALTYIESNGVVSMEGEAFSSRTINGATLDQYTIVPGESAGAGPNSNFRGKGYVQSLPDDQIGTGSGPNIGATVSYEVNISTPGTYRLFLRWDGNATVGGGGNADSIFADIVELKDGSGGAIADHYEYNTSVDGNFNTNAWDGNGGFELNTATGTPKVAANFNITTPGKYNVRVSQREDGSTVDALVLQLANLAAPSNTGPVVSLTEGQFDGVLRSIAATNDAYVRSGTGANVAHGATDSGNLVVKSTGTDTSRKSYVQFDIAGLAGRIQDAAIDLQVNINNGNPSGSTGPAQFTLEVFGLNDGAGEGWNESTLTFNNAPGNAAGNGVNAGLTTFLGSINIPAINPALTTDPILISFADIMASSPDALVNFLNADTDGLVTFILRRTSDSGSFNLGFFSSEATGGAGPVLRVNIAVPEPATALLGVIGLVVLARRRRAA